MFKKQKVSLIKKIINNNDLVKSQCNNCYSRKFTVNYCLFLGLYYNLNVIVYYLIENYSQYIAMSIFVLDQDILTKHNKYNYSLNDYVPAINYKINSPYIKTSCLDLIVKNI